MLHLTLSSDFGLLDHAPAVIKGKFYSAFRNITITDITHVNNPNHLKETIYHVKASAPYFPANSFHLIFNNIYEDPYRRIMYTCVDDQHFFCANNGLLPLMFNDRAATYYFLEESVQPYNYIQLTDVLIRQIELLHQGNKQGLIPANAQDMFFVNVPMPAMQEKGIDLRVLWVDGFGNVVLDINRAQFEEVRRGRTFRIINWRYDEINSVSQHYNDVAPGQLLCLFNTAGNLEIAMNKGNAASLIGISLTDEREKYFYKIKLHFDDPSSSTGV
jgi:S-adenosylmethionine hydrolase